MKYLCIKIETFKHYVNEPPYTNLVAQNTVAKKSSDFYHHLVHWQKIIAAATAKFM